MPAVTLVSKAELSAGYAFDADRFPVEAVRELLTHPAVVDMRVEPVDIAEIVRQVYTGQNRSGAA